MLPNLTRSEAIERAALVTVDGYRIELDLTVGDKEFRSRTTVEFEALPGADSYIDLAADRVHRAVLNGHDIDVSGYDEARGIAATGREDRADVDIEAAQAGIVRGVGGDADLHAGGEDDLAVGG